MGIERFGDINLGVPRKGATREMMSRKKTREPQASQELGQGLSSTKFRVAENQIPAYEPMTGDQASHLKKLSEEVHEPRAFHHRLSRAEASRRIDALIDRLRLGVLPPHTD
jgi:hypothetical protein